MYFSKLGCARIQALLVPVPEELTWRIQGTENFSLVNYWFFWVHSGLVDHTSHYINLVFLHVSLHKTEHKYEYPPKTTSCCCGTPNEHVYGYG